jgi:hypothetical protein
MSNIDGRNLAQAIRLWNGIGADAGNAELARALGRMRDELEAVRREIDEAERRLIERLVSEAPRKYSFDNPPPAPRMPA